MTKTFRVILRHAGFREALHAEVRGEWRRIKNRWYDLRAVLVGYCNHGCDEFGGGYSHWRCALKRGHRGFHRARNYVWNEDGRVEYKPIPILSLETTLPQQPWDRDGIRTRRQARRHNRWGERSREERQLTGASDG